MNPDSLRSHVSDLLQALVCCFKDDSWPVRDGMSDSDVPFLFCEIKIFLTFKYFPSAAFTYFLFFLGEFCF